MSELTKCNFCSLRELKRRARKEGTRIVIRANPGKLKGVDVYLVPKGVKVPQKIMATTEGKHGDMFHVKYFAAWFMALTDYCVC